LAGVPRDRECLTGAATLQSRVERLELPPSVSPRLLLHPSRDRRAPLSREALGWDPHWKETPVAVWFQGLRHAVVAVQISYVSYGGGLESRWANWVLVNSDEVIDALVHLRRLFVNAPRPIAVLGGHDI